MSNCGHEECKQMNVDLQALYDNEINFKLSTFWDAGFEWCLGDEFNGYIAHGRADTYAEACLELYEAAAQHWPNSEFAKKVTKGRCLWCHNWNPDVTTPVGGHPCIAEDGPKTGMMMFAECTCSAFNAGRPYWERDQ